MRILIDTNILIKLEGNHEIDIEFARFYQLAFSNKCDMFYHKGCIEDIKRDKNEERRRITLSKLSKYVTMQDPGHPTETFVSALGGQKNDNDKIDNVQLYQIYKGYADYFITEDNGIHSKATRINLQAKVLTITEGLALLKDKFTLVLPQHPLLETCSVREIENELSSNFFDSLRENYPGFDKWFKECAKNNRQCYVLKTDNKMGALLIYKREDPLGHKIAGIDIDAYKMCTFKVDETAFGYKLGELFLNKMFELCMNVGVKYLYLTVFPHHNHLIELLTKYGFTIQEFKNKDNGIELRMIKSLEKMDYERSSQAMTSHPFYCDGDHVNKYIIPIRPEFYNTLFKDGGLRDRTLFDQTEDSLNEIEGNTISKAYICKSKRISMKPGDLLFFYGSGKRKSIEPVGILDQVVYTADLEEIKRLVRRKTVYSDDVLQEIVKGDKKVTVLIFRLIYYLNKPIVGKEIKSLESYSNNFQTITTLIEEDYKQLKAKGYFNERFIIHQA